jgi:Z1 domain-containing protein
MDQAETPEEGPWTVDIEGNELTHLAQRRSQEMSEEDWQGVVRTAASILGRCPQTGVRAGRTTCLALGKIQSGKTLSYTALISLAVDNGYRITVVLAGTKNPLLEQIHARLISDLVDPRLDVIPFKNPSQQDTMVMEGVLRGTGHVLIVVLKHRQRLDDVRNVLSAPELCGYPTLIIDDEGDEASLNTQFRRGRQSAIYTSILRLRDALHVHAYVAYTATPQANLLIQGIDGLAPDFGVLVNPGQLYCGGFVFFGPDRDRYVRPIPMEEADGGYLGPIPDGIKRAIAIFLIGGAIRHRSDPTQWHSLLIHNSHLRVDHERLQSDVNNLVINWREILALPDGDPARSDLLLPLFRDAYADLNATVASAPTWEEVSGLLRNESLQVEVWMVNSLPLGRDPIGTPFRVRNNIMIGGNMLGRGLTIPGLAVTYITRRAQNETNADTMEQRARWFGYKQNYLDVCRIFLTDQLRDNYTELLRHEDDFWEALRRNERQGLSIREWPRLFSLDSDMGLRPTRSNVADFRQFRGSDWDVQNQLIVEEVKASANVRAVRQFFQRHPATSVAFGNVEHGVLECPTDVLLMELLASIDNEGTDWDDAYTKEYLTRLLLQGVLPSVQVVFMSNGRARDRTQRAGRVNPMQGRSPNRFPSDPSYYPGDENIHDGHVQLQVHIIREEGEGLVSPVETTALALYVPQNEERFNLRLYVRGVGVDPD